MHICDILIAVEVESAALFITTVVHLSKFTTFYKINYQTENKVYLPICSFSGCCVSSFFKPESMIIAYVNNFGCREESPLKSSKLESKAVACDVSDGGREAGRFPALLVNY